MSKLNFTAGNDAEKRILEYLETNASDTLTEKINNGVYIEKEGKQLLNKKDLKGFMRFACEQARELAEKGANSACVADNVVYGWAVHYFEEDSIIGTLYNDDGTEYISTKNRQQPTNSTKEKPVVTKTEPQDKQVSIFDFSLPTTHAEPPETVKTPPTAEQEEQFFDEFDSNVRMLSQVEETENDQTPPSSTRQATAINTPEPTESPITNSTKFIQTNTTPPSSTRQATVINTHATKTTLQYSQPKQTNSPAELFYYKYEIIQKQYPNHILFYRLGDFYEAFGKSAELASEALDLTLTGKNCGSVGRVPMCGVPYHAVEIYVEKLRKKYGVVLMNSDTELQEYPKKESVTVHANAKKETVSNKKVEFVANEEKDNKTNNLPTSEYAKCFNNVDDYTNKVTGEIVLPNIDKELFDILYKLFDGQIVMG